MRISRRLTLAYAPALTALTAVPALAENPRDPAASQSVQHLVIHEDEGADAAYMAPIAHAATDTVWDASGDLTETAFIETQARRRANGFALRRLSAFQTRGGMRYAAIWQWHGPEAVRVRHGLTGGALSSELASNRDLHLAHLDATATANGPRFAAIWTAERKGEQAVRTGLTADQLGREGLRQLAGYMDNGAPRFAAVFAGTAPVEAAHALSPAEFRARHFALVAQGYRLRDASGYVHGTAPFYTAVWEKV